jgi:polyhydroxyalkanoate synthesis regulator phasin
MAEDRKSRKEGISGGIKQGLGVLSAFKEAVEETISEARERGELSTDRAKEIMKGALDRAQEAAGEARERGREFVSQREFDGVREVVGDLKVRVQELEHRIRKGMGQEEEAAEGEESGSNGVEEEEDPEAPEDGKP